MEFIATTLLGIEDIAVREIGELISAEAKQLLPGHLSFRAKDVKKLVYRGKSIIKIFQLLANFKFNKEEGIYDSINKIEFKIKEPFVVRCLRIGKHGFSSSDIERNVGGLIFNKGFKVDLKNPATKILVEILGDRCLVGIENADMLNKRTWRIKVNNQSINPCMAYSLLRLADWKPGEILVDPFCRDGVIAIEVALCFKSSKVYAFDSSANNIRNAKINAEYAGVKINFKKCDASWIDTMFKKGEIDKVVTSLPFVSKRLNENEAVVLYKDLFNQLDYTLKSNGKIVIVSIKPEPVKKCIGKFKIVEERKVFVGELIYTILVLAK